MSIWRVIPSLLDPVKDTVEAYTVREREDGSFEYARERIPADATFDEAGRWSDTRAGEFIERGHP